MDIETSPFEMTDAGGNVVLTFSVRRTAAGTAQTVIAAGDGQEVMTIGADNPNKSNFVQFFNQPYDDPQASFTVRRPNGTHGDVWMQASVLVGTEEACTKDGNPSRIGDLENGGIPLDPAGCINIARRLTHRPGEHNAVMCRFWGKYTDDATPQEALGIGTNRSADPLRPYFRIHGSDGEQVRWEISGNYFREEVHIGGVVSRMVWDKDNTLKYEGFNGQPTTLAP